VPRLAHLLCSVSLCFLFFSPFAWRRGVALSGRGFLLSCCVLLYLSTCACCVLVWPSAGWPHRLG
jgi:hypothetical protein